jgi:hypothetical protein
MDVGSLFFMVCGDGGLLPGQTTNGNVMVSKSVPLCDTRISGFQFQPGKAGANIPLSTHVLGTLSLEL